MIIKSTVRARYTLSLDLKAHQWFHKSINNSGVFSEDGYNEMNSNYTYSFNLTRRK